MRKVPVVASTLEIMVRKYSCSVRHNMIKAIITSRMQSLLSTDK